MAIDDSPVIRTIIEYTLARVGFQVVAYADGMSAMRALQEGQTVVPDLLLLDVDLPRMSGYELRICCAARTVICQSSCFLGMLACLIK